jgi:transcriptional regulator of acetoin/glycerol metabolism
MGDELAYQDHRDLIVKNSWRRCKNQFQLDREVRKPIDVLSENEVRLRQDSLHHFLEHSAEVITAVRRLAKQSDYCVLIADGSGVTVNEFADTVESSEYRNHGLITGSVWNEDNIGTNGIGTCLANKQCTTISGIEHYADHLKNFTCTAAPIFDTQEKIIGAINISRMVSEDYIESFFTHSFIQEAAKQISANIFLSLFKDHNIISCSPYSNVSLYESKALLAFDDNGIIQGATKDCLEILGELELYNLVGQSLETIIPEPVERIFSKQKHFLEIKEGPMANNFVKGLRISANVTSDRALPILRKKHTAKKILIENSTESENERFEDFSGSEKNVQRCVEIGKRLINKDIPLLLLGETGVGKDTLAKLLHETSDRKDQPFVALNCAAIPPSLMDSELFGYMPGTFTDGLKDGKKGKILASNKGTLFLDEIGDMPINLQAHLLRVLEEREVTPLGAVEPIPVDIKVICATHKNISELIEQGLFRQDLLYRIKGAEITLPPLRERTNLQEIIHHILSSQPDETEKNITISNDVMNIFENYNWPGNIRELKSVIRYALCFCDGKTIKEDDLPEQLLQMFNAGSIDNNTNNILKDIVSNKENSFSLEATKSSSEAKILQNILIRNNWNITTTAEKLEISRSTLHRKIKKYGIVAPNKMGE